MINTSRWIDIAIFNINEPIVLGGLMIKAGFQQVVRIDGFYYFNMVGMPAYLRLPMHYNDDVVKIIFSQKIIF